MYTITHSINYFSQVECRSIPAILLLFYIRLLSQGEAQAMFLRHEGYLGAIGAFMKGVHERGDEYLVTMAIICYHSDYIILTDAEKYSWAENKALSSGLQSPVPVDSFLNEKPNMTVRSLVFNAESSHLDARLYIHTQKSESIKVSSTCTVDVLLFKLCLLLPPSILPPFATLVMFCFLLAVAYCAFFVGFFFQNKTKN